MNHCREHGVNNCRDCGMRQLAADSFKAQITPAKEKDMKTEKVTKDVFFSPFSNVFFQAGEVMPDGCIPATLTYELPRKPMKVEFETVVREYKISAGANNSAGIGLQTCISDFKLGPLRDKKVKVTIEEIEEVE